MLWRVLLRPSNNLSPLWKPLGTTQPTGLRHLPTELQSRLMGRLSPPTQDTPDRWDETSFQILGHILTKYFSSRRKARTSQSWCQAIWRQEKEQQLSLKSASTLWLGLWSRLRNWSNNSTLPGSGRLGEPFGLTIKNCFNKSYWPEHHGTTPALSSNKTNWPGRIPCTLCVLF